MTAVTKCANCGAPLTTTSDGTTEGCGYCGYGRARAIDPVALAHSLRQGHENVVHFVERLAGTLESAFPSQTRIERKGIFSKQVSEIHVEVGNHVFVLHASDSQAETHRVQTVRGVKLRDEKLALHHWIDALSQALAQLANENDQAREAISKFVR